MKEYIVKVYEDKTEWYNKEGQLHRDNGPAYEHSSGHKEWYKNGELHRKDGPAQEFPNGHKSWHQYGELHREDGPAIEFSNGEKNYFLNDQQYSEEEYHKKIVTRASDLDDTIVLYGKKYKLVEEK